MALNPHDYSHDPQAGAGPRPVAGLFQSLNQFLATFEMAED